MDVDGQTLLRVGFAALLGAVVGFERELRDKPAGLRTHILVGATACLLVSLGQRAVSLAPPGLVQTDPIRVMQTVILGISFLGAGTIFVKRGSGRVAGLTTAASILVTAALGLAVGLGEGLTAACVAAFVVVVLTVVGRVEGVIHRAKPRASQDAVERAGHRVADALPRGA